MTVNYEIREIPLSSRLLKNRADAFLGSQGLSLDAGLDYLAGVYDSEDSLVGCAGLDGSLIKCVAVSDALRGENIAASLVSHLFSRLGPDSREAMLFTKPGNAALFRALGFHEAGRSAKAVMMLADAGRLRRYTDMLASLPRGSRNGVIVMNANPMTLGHLHLIRHAAARVDALTVIPLDDNPLTLFSCAARTEMLRRATVSIPNVTVADAGPFTISAATFPSYFLKEKSDVADAQIALDLDIFIRHIAPALNASVRFAGSEPSDPLTALYNRRMQELLPAAGIEFEEIPRLEAEGVPVSASRVRTLTSAGRLGNAIGMVPPASLPFLLARGAASALQRELDLTPKPGLVDRDDSGAHSDMDHVLMSRSIRSLEPHFVRMAAIAMDDDSLPVMAERLRNAGIEAERDMMRATGGVNTHRGAIFSMGLALASVARLLADGKTLLPQAIAEGISAVAAMIPDSRDTHGASVRSRHNAPGALQTARDGYATLFDCWLPALRRDRAAGTDARETEIRLLLLIITTLSDTNAIYRVGPEEARNACREAARLLDDFSIEGVRTLNKDFTARGISHGGAADMLALTLFLDSILL